MSVLYKKRFFLHGKMREKGKAIVMDVIYELVLGSRIVLFLNQGFDKKGDFIVSKYYKIHP